MYVVTVEFRIFPEHVDAFRQAITENAAASLKTEVDCHQFDVCTDDADPTLIYLYELYTDAEAFQTHLKTAHFLEMNARTASWVVGKAVKTFKRIQPA
jgi:autoinducer 2-degrading protein